MCKILSNGTAGLIDLNLTQQQKVLNAYCFPYVLNDYSALILGASPKEGQSLFQAQNLLLDQIEKLKKGDFPDWILQAVITDLKVSQTQSYSTNRGRADDLLDAFTANIDYQNKINQLSRLEKITKAQIIEFANKHFATNYVVVYKHTGEDKNVQKVVKPVITPVEVNRNAQSDFLKNLVSAKVPDIEPVFIDYQKDIQQWIFKMSARCFKCFLLL